MENKDKLGLEIKGIMEEEAFNVTLSQTTVDNIVKHKKKKLSHKINDFLNKEIEIPLAPSIIGLAALLLITIIPKDVLKSQNERTIDFGGSQVIVRESYEVSKK
ncbi:hypothetical protein [Sedimentibacter sp. MB31-C6]|uniref:hypothetical protein n=1 Tax=Sedimentibacter sp. MB31-C6 TaxID=3109366 RepID=UPI002DDD2054|nr:hypothetical protein [Sedimentibacter sp. MB36-C1]WSI03222.1 hypothetical protein U8307_09215 [Sedimentibacter sp. MB36-C1]